MANVRGPTSSEAGGTTVDLFEWRCFKAGDGDDANYERVNLITSKMRVSYTDRQEGLTRALVRKEENIQPICFHCPCLLLAPNWLDKPFQPAL